MNLKNRMNISAEKEQCTVNYLKKAKLNCFRDRSTSGKTTKKSKEIIITKLKQYSYLCGKLMWL